MEDYICEAEVNKFFPTDASFSSMVSAGKSYPIRTYPFELPPYFTSSYLAFLANISNDKEPASYDEASVNPAWVEAMQKELEAL